MGSAKSSPSDLAAIEAAVRAAEARTTGEIYCVVTEESSHYTEIVDRLGGGRGPAGPGAAAAGRRARDHPGPLRDLERLRRRRGDRDGGAPRADRRHRGAGRCCSWSPRLLVSIPPVRRALTPKGLKRLRVQRRARRAVHRQEPAPDARADRGADLRLAGRADGRADRRRGHRRPRGAARLGQGHGGADRRPEARRGRGRLRRRGRPLRRRAGREVPGTRPATTPTSCPTPWWCCPGPEQSP